MMLSALWLGRRASRQSLVATVASHQQWSMEEIQLCIHLFHLSEVLNRNPHVKKVTDQLTPH